VSFPDLIENPGSMHEFESTKNEFRNFWNLIQDIYIADPERAKRYLGVIYGEGQKRYDALKIINKSPHIRNIFPQLTLELLDDIRAVYGQRSQLFQAVLESKNIKTCHNSIKKHPYLLDALNTLPPSYITALLDQNISPEIWGKINSIKDSTVLPELFANIVFGDAYYMVANGFLLLAQEASTEEFLALIDLYQSSGLDVIRIIDQGLNSKPLVMEIHRIFMDQDTPLSAKKSLLKGLTGFELNTPQDKLMWQQRISANLFTPSHTDVVDTIKQFLLIEHDKVLIGLLGLVVKFGNNGYTQIKFLLKELLQDYQVHPLLTAMKELQSGDVALLMQELVWTNQGEILLANKFLEFSAGLESATLACFLRSYLDSVYQTNVFPRLLQSIELSFSSVYQYLCDKKGVVYKNLMLELQLLDSVARNNLLTKGSAVLFQKLQKIETFPFLLSGVLQIGTHSDPSEDLQERYMLDFLDAMINKPKSKQPLKNVAYAIESLANRQITRAFVPFVRSKFFALDCIGCENTVANGREKSTVLLNALFTQDGEIRKNFINGILDNNTIPGVVDGLVIQKERGEWQVLSGFINVIDSQNEDVLVEQYNSFLLNDNDPYRFVHLVSQLAGNSLKAEQCFNLLMQKKLEERKHLIADIMIAGKIERLFHEVMQGQAFQQFEEIRQKSESMYKVLLILLSKTNDEQMQELRSLINQKENGGDFDSEVSYQNVIRFIQGIDSNSNLTKALNEAFNEKIPQEAAAYVEFMVKIFDLEYVIEALDQLPQEQSVILIKAFTEGHTNLLKMLNQLSSVASCVRLLQCFCYEDDKNANYPIVLCSNMMTCLDRLSSVEMLQLFINFRNDEDNLLLDFEAAIESVIVQDPLVIDKIQLLLQDSLFVGIVQMFDKKTRQSLLIEVLVDYEEIKTSYLTSPQVMMPLLATYCKSGDLAKIHAMRQNITTQEGAVETLSCFINTNRDPKEKLLIAVIAMAKSESFDFDVQKVNRLKQATEYFVNLKEALLRFSARPNIRMPHIIVLISYLLEDGMFFTNGGKINEHFGFPQKKMTVAEDHWVYDQFLKAIEFYNKKSKRA